MILFRKYISMWQCPWGMRMMRWRESLPCWSLSAPGIHVLCLPRRGWSFRRALKWVPTRPVPDSGDPVSPPVTGLAHTGSTPHLTKTAYGHCQRACAGAYRRRPRRWARSVHSSQKQKPAPWKVGNRLYGRRRPRLSLTAASGRRVRIRNGSCRTRRDRWCSARPGGCS